METGACLFRGRKSLRAVPRIRASAYVFSNCRWNRLSGWLLLPIIKVTFVLAFAQVLFCQAEDLRLRLPSLKKTVQVGKQNIQKGLFLLFVEKIVRDLLVL